MKKPLWFLVLFLGLWAAFHRIADRADRSARDRRLTQTNERQRMQRIMREQQNQRSTTRRPDMGQRSPTPRGVILPPDVLTDPSSDDGRLPASTPIIPSPSESAPASPPPQVVEAESTPPPGTTAEIPPKPEVPPVVFSEIMYHWMDGQQENTHLEFLELTNVSPVAMDLAGWKLTKGVNFTFPERKLEPEERLVVSADPKAFAERHPNAADLIVLGPWEGSLSNGGEKLRLETQEGKTVVELTYANQGDWAMRVASTQQQRRRGGIRMFFGWGNNEPDMESASGWDWISLANGKGYSLELVNPKLPCDLGANWRASNEPGGTPGRVNYGEQEDSAPIIRKARHEPAVPEPGKPVLVTAHLDDEDPAQIKGWVLWRVSSDQGVPYQKTAMHHRGGGVFAALLPAQEDKTVIEFYLEASDGRNTRQWPNSKGQGANCLMQFDGEKPELGQAMYRLVFTQQDYERFVRGSTYGDEMRNVTIILDDGSGPRIRYLCGVRPRGSNSRSHRPVPMRVALPHDTPWHGAVRLNLNTYFSWLQMLGMRVYEDSGFRSPEAIPVKVRLQGQDHFQGGEMDYGMAVHLQPLDGNYIEQHFPEDKGGNLYKKIRPDNDWAYREGNYSFYPNDGWSKQTNASANDWTDLDNFLRVMSESPDDLGEVAKVMDIDYWLRWFAVGALLANGEGGISRGVDDDYALYRGHKDGRFFILPHDMDTICGIGDNSSIGSPRHSLLDFADNGERISALATLLGTDNVKQRYYWQMRDLLETSFSPARFEATVESTLGGWVPDDTRQQVKQFMAARVSYATSQVAKVIGDEAHERPAPTAETTFKAGAGKVVMSEVVAVGQDAVELHNPGQEAVDLTGMGLTDKPEEPSKFTFPPGTKLPPGGYLVLHADDQSAEGELHTGFGLSEEGETLLLLGAPGAEGKRETLDSITFGAQIVGHSIGRVGQAWTLTQPSLGAANQAVECAGPTQIRINEWLALPDARYQADFVELYNQSEQAAALGGLALTDDSINYPKRFVIPPLSFIAAKGFATFESQGKHEPRATRFPFKLAAHYGNLTLFGSNGMTIDRIHYISQPRDVSRGRVPDGGEEFAFFPIPTPQAKNRPADASSETARRLLQGLRITEIMFHPADEAKTEFVELSNIGEQALPLEGLRFTEGIEFTFGQLSLEPGKSIVVVSNRQDFQAKYGADVVIAGEFKGKLSRKGEALQLRLPAPETLAIQRFKFNDKWFPSADGAGKTLCVIDARAPVEDWGRSTTWMASKEDGGNPGRFP